MTQPIGVKVMSKTATILTLLGILGVLLLLENVLSFLLQLVLNDPTIQFPLVRWLIRVFHAITLLGFEITHMIGMVFGVPFGVFSLGQIAATLASAFGSFIGVIEAIFNPIFDLLAISLEALILNAIIKLITG